MPAKSSAAARERAPLPEREGPVELGVLHEVLGFRLRRIHNHLWQNFAQTLAARDLKPGEFSALALVAANPGISQIELAREGGFDKATIVSMLDDLERWGWAVRRRSTADRRRHSLFVTPAGQEMLREIAVLAKGNETAVEAALTPTELATFSLLLDRIYDACFHADA